MIKPISPPSGVIHYIDWKYETDYTLWSIEELTKHLEAFDIREKLEKELGIIRKNFMKKRGDTSTVDSIIEGSKKIKLTLGTHENEELQDAFNTSATADDDFY